MSFAQAENEAAAKAIDSNTNFLIGYSPPYYWHCETISIAKYRGFFFDF
jgi:hypothetical protein